MSAGVRHAAMAALLGLSARQAVQETSGAKSCSLRRYQKLGLVEEREVNRRIMALLSLLEATGPAR